MSETDELLADLRPAVFAIAYRMLGSVASAEDVVQETLLRVHRALDDGQAIASPRAFAATVATRLSIDELRSARARRETYVGEWLPEPVVDAPGAYDPAQRAEMADSLSLAFLVVLESLSPEQRAVLLLHDVFGFGYDEVAAIVATTPANARQLAVRARRHVDERRPRYEASQAQRTELAARFFAAARDGDLEGLQAMLADDVVLHGDGGGKVPALARSLHGRGRVAKTLVAWGRQGSRIGASSREVVVNGQPGAMFLDRDGRVFGVMAIDILDGQIQGLRSIVNPDKLRHLGAVSDLGEQMRASRRP